MKPPTKPSTLLAVPNASEGRDRETIDALAGAFAGDGAGKGERDGVSADVRLLDVHSDGDHHRSVFTLAGEQGALARALLRGAAVAVERIDVMGDRPNDGPAAAGRPPRQHPHVGALDVVPIVYLEASSRGAACAEALVVADRIADELEVPVFLYGELTGEREVTRAQLRRGGVGGLARRMQARVRPDFGPWRLHPSAGATLVAARPPLVAFNLQLADPASVADARAIATLIRAGGEEGIAGVRAIGVELSGGVAQVSMNVEQPLQAPLAVIVEAVARHARVASAELVGLAPKAALEGFPEHVQLLGFDAARHVIENAIGANALRS